MNSGVTSERVYDALKRRVLDGRIMPGQKLEPAGFADELASSVTPVRDALHRLVGERLVEARTSDGFYLPLVTEPALRDLYIWNAQLLRMIAQSWVSSDQETIANDLPADIERATPAFFRLFAVRSSIIQHEEQIDAANDRLSAPRAAEQRILTGIEAELRALAVAFDNGPASLLKLIAAYHRRRYKATSSIVRAMYRL